MNALVLNVQRMSTEDGPGLRTTVFFKGCPLACTWCHNPESLSPRPEVVVHPERCISCGTCVDACPHGAVPRSPGDPVDPCQACGTCCDECPAGARERLGTTWTLDALAAEVAKDRAYFEASGGGVTVSGGEPALQAAFVEAFLARCRGLGLRTALDTCGQCPPDVLLGLAGQATLVMFDLKLIDARQHRRFTGVSNDRILANLLALRDWMDRVADRPALWIRTPLIPGATATPGNLRGLGAFLAAELGDRVQRWDLCAFNNLCRGQYRRLGRDWAFATTDLMTRADVELLAAVARTSGVDPGIVRTSGATRREDA